MSDANERRITGIHHVTAIAADPQPNLDFYAQFLGLRLVKRTVNFDDPETYHFYYGDDTGKPGTILTFFPWPGARRGRIGTGQVTLTSFRVPSESMDYWSARARRYGFEAVNQPERFGEPVLRITDPDGMLIELIGSGAGLESADGVEIPSEHAVQAIHSATLTHSASANTIELLVKLMGFREVAREGARVRFVNGHGDPAGFCDLVTDHQAPRGLGGAGTVHHIAFRTPDETEQLRWQQVLMEHGYQVSPQMDRKYFSSIYFREPGGVLFEIATDGPGFAVDEPADSLGSTLQLPAMYESRRAQLEAVLPEITVPASSLLSESY